MSPGWGGGAGGGGHEVGWRDRLGPTQHPGEYLKFEFKSKNSSVDFLAEALCGEIDFFLHCCHSSPSNLTYAMASQKAGAEVVCSCSAVRIPCCVFCRQKSNDTDRTSLPAGPSAFVGWRVKTDCNKCGPKYAKGEGCYRCFDTRRSPDFRHLADVGECVDERAKAKDLDERFMAARSDRIDKFERYAGVKKNKSAIIVTWKGQYEEDFISGSFTGLAKWCENNAPRQISGTNRAHFKFAKSRGNDVVRDKHGGCPLDSRNPWLGRLPV